MLFFSKKVSLLWLLMIGFSSAFAQNTFTVGGTLRDAETGETLIGATVEILGQAGGAVSNEYGFFSLNVPDQGKEMTLKFSYIGYETQSIPVNPTQNLRMDINLTPAGAAMKEVVIEANSLEEKKRSTEMSVSTISIQEAKALPALFGEVDVIKILQLKPGITAGSEGTTGLFVRGGGGDQNLIVLDEAVVYNANHLFGFFSTFSPDAVKDLKVYKGGFPAQYGGRLSSVIDVRMKEGNNKKYTASGGIGLISSRLTVEGPIQKEKSSFIVSGRRTYVDIFTRQVNKANEGKEDFSPIPDYYFYDLNTKVNFTLSEKDRLFVSGYFGRDVFGFDNETFNFNFDWGNATLTSRWNHIYNSKLFSNTTFTFSDYQYNIRNAIQGFSFDLGSNVRDYNGKIDFFYNPDNDHTVRFGANVTRHEFKVARLRAGSDDGEVSFSSGLNFTSLEYGLYANDEWAINPKIKLNYGLRVSGWENGPASYGRLEPRVSFNYTATPKLSLKTSYSRMHQYVHLLASSGLSLPTDIWYPSSENVKPETSDQIAVGLSYLASDKLLITWEAWYKKLQNQIDFVDGAELFGNDNLETELTFGDGYAYSPLELEIEKQNGRVTGWIGYTLAWVRRGNFAAINNGAYFPPRFDTRHNLSVVALYDFGRQLTKSNRRRWQVTGTFVYTSGYNSWLPSGRFSFQDLPGAPIQPVVPIYGPRNSFRYPAYIRADLGLVWRFEPRWGESDLTLSIYNASDRRNPYFIFLDPIFQDVVNPDGGPTASFPIGVKAKQVSLFPVLPSLTWNFKF